MDSSRADARSVVPRTAAAAVIGAALACGAVNFFSWVEADNARACENVDGLCWTWWDLTQIPLTLATAVIVLVIAYRQLGIRPRTAIIPPTVLLAPFPLTAAQSMAGGWMAVVAGGAWSASTALTALTAPSRQAILGLTASATLFLASLVVLY